MIPSRRRRGELDEQTSPATKIGLRHLFASYREATAAGRPLPAVSSTGFRVFSETDEDGIVLYLLAVLDAGSLRFVDLGAGDCVSASNCANLALNLGYHGVFVDADAGRIEAGRKLYAEHRDTRAYPPRTVHARLTRDNVNSVIRAAGIEGPVDVLSIDVDGDDYWLWEAIDCITPEIVVIETHTEYRLHDVLSPYGNETNETVGASPVAMNRLATRLGYRLVGSNRYGFNAFYIREGAARVIPTVGVEHQLRHDWSREPSAWSEPPGAS
jgi:hypothetical protein